MTTDADSTSDGQHQDDWQDTATDLLEHADRKLRALERDADGSRQRAVSEGRELLDELASTLDQSSDEDGFEEYDTVDVSEGKKRP